MFAHESRGEMFDQERKAEQGRAGHACIRRVCAWRAIAAQALLPFRNPERNDGEFS
jgi:hypothetical protein